MSNYVIPAIAFLLGAALMISLYLVSDRAYLRSIINKVYTDCITVDSANSRLAFLVGSLGSTLALLALTVGFLVTKDRSAYPTMVAAISGGGLGHAVGRFFTKKGDATKSDPASPDGEDSQETPSDQK